MRVLVYLEKATVRGGIEVFAERHVAQLRAAGHEVDVIHSISDSQLSTFNSYDEVVVHKCSDVATLEVFPPEKTIYYVHDHEPICPRAYAYTPGETVRGQVACGPVFSARRSVGHGRPRSPACSRRGGGSVRWRVSSGLW